MPHPSIEYSAGTNAGVPAAAYELPRNTSAYIDTRYPVLDSSRAHNKFGIYAPAVAGIEAADMQFWLLHTSAESAFNRDFVIVSDDFTASDLSRRDSRNFKGVECGENVVIGSKKLTERFAYSPYVSGRHFQVEYNKAGLFVRNLEPTNNTKLLLGGPEQYAHGTHLVQQRIGQLAAFGEPDSDAPHGYYLNMPILGRESRRIDGGVYFGGSPREGLVVDGKSRPMQQAYKELTKDLMRGPGNPTIQATLGTINKRARAIMPYNGTRTQAISESYRGDKLIGISTYIEEGAGVCRQQALLAGYLIERCVQDDILPGNPGIERNTVPDMGGTHAWAMHHAPLDIDRVVDVAQKFTGTKDEARFKGLWEYRLSTDVPYVPADLS